MKHSLWGKRGSDSLVGRLSRTADPKKEYAELWVGGHPNSSSLALVDGTRVPLVELLSKNPTLLGGHVTHGLPFLFKILSIRVPLSIQAHPDRKLAQFLHDSDPSHYPDTNHKPEIGVAITPVELLYGFRALKEIIEMFRANPEVRSLLSSELYEEVCASSASSESKTLETIHRSVAHSTPEQIKSAAHELYARLEKKSDRTKEEEWIWSLRDIYPDGDVGLFYFYLLNLVSLPTGKGIFTEPNVAHAYLSGDVIECMANSDNVVRGGLTEKYRDVDTLCSMLAYRGARPHYVSKEPWAEGEPPSWYKTSAEEFSVEVFESQAGEATRRTNNRAEIIFCLEGNPRLQGQFGEERLKPGDAFFIPAVISQYALKLDGAKLARAFTPPVT